MSIEAQIREQEAVIRGLTAKIRELQLKTAADIADAWAKKRNTDVKGSKARFDKIRSFFSGFGGPIWRDFSPYLVLIIIILIFIGFSKFPIKKPNMSRLKPKSWWVRFKIYVALMIEKVFPVATFRRWFNPMGKVETIDRTKNSGRCDNMEWRQLVDRREPYGGGFCIKTHVPKPFVWNIDPKKLPEYERLPEKLRNSITKNGRKMQIFIPYEKQATFYVPQCDKAYYKDLDANGQEVNVLLSSENAQVLRDNGLTCSLIEKQANQLKGNSAFRAKYRRTEHNTSQDRDKTFKCSA